MKRKQILFLTFSAAAFSLGLLNTNVSVSADTYDTQIAQKNASIAQATSTISSLTASATQLKTQNTVSTNKVQQVNASLKTIGTALSEEQATLDSLKAAVATVADITVDVDAPSKIAAKTILPDSHVTPINVTTAKTDSVATVEQSTEKNNVSAYELQIADLQKNLAQLNADLEKNATQQTTIQKTITTNHAKVTQAQAAITTLKAQQAASKSVAGLRTQLVAAAYAQLGKPYVWGGQGPDVFDCSGLMNYLYTNVAHMSIGSWTSPQESAGVQIPVSEAQPGDLLFFGSPGATSHVAMYIGGGQFIHAPQPGEVVKVTAIAYYAPTFAVRVLGN